MQCSARFLVAPITPVTPITPVAPVTPVTPVAINPLVASIAFVVLTTLIVIVALAAPLPLAAQPEAPPRPAVATKLPGWSIPPGSVLRLLPHYGVELKARAVGQFGDTLVVQPMQSARDPIAFTPGDIESAWIRDGSYAERGILVGGLTGLLVKTAWAWSQCGGPCAPSSLETEWTLVLTGGGALVGLVVGGSIPRWRPIE